ncbi:hypothetical protein ACFQ3Z_15750 [Streptomyces nogalater]
MDAVRSGKATASHAAVWAVVELACALGQGRCTAAQATLADAVGTSTPRLARLLADNSPLLANLDGRGPLVAQERQERGLPTHFFARRKGGQLGGWAPTWTLTLVCDGTSHEQLVPIRLISPSAWLLYAVLVWWAGDEDPAVATPGISPPNWASRSASCGSGRGNCGRPVCCWYATAAVTVGSPVSPR